MPKITIDGTVYHTEDLTEDGQAQLASLQYLEIQLDKLRKEIATFELAKQDYATALRVELEASGVAPIPVEGDA
jgi:hypothetical protein